MIEKKNLRAALWYNGLSLFVLLFGMIYTYFGHGVTSEYMSFAFLPLQCVGLAYLLLAVITTIPRPKRFSSTFIAFSVAAFTLYRITKGIMAIAGAYSNYDSIILIAGILCLVIAVILYPTEIILCQKQSNTQ